MFADETDLKIEISDAYTELGQCRCCMAKGYHRDVQKEYYYNNIREVYLDLFMDCFNLPLSTDDYISSLICMNCVHRLRDACSFRMMVASTERQLLQGVASNNNVDTLFVNVPDTIAALQSATTEIKVEMDAEDLHIEPDIFKEPLDGFCCGENKDDISQGSDGDVGSKDVEGSDDEMDDDCDSTTRIKEDEQPLELVEGEAQLLARFSKVITPLPKRSELPTVCPEYHDHLMMLKDKVVTPKSIEWFLRPPKEKQREFISDKLALALNTSVLFEHSNATAFKTKMRNGYPCFYCREIYNPEALRKHQTTHPKTNIYKLLTKYTADELIVYADITDLKCTICDENMNKLTDLKTHLVEKHENFFYEYPDRVIPFKLKDKDFECQVCGLVLETFGAVERHMNKHFGNFICEECGAGFITKHRLDVHSYMQHRQEKFSCNVCKKDFTSQIKYRIHYEAVHLMLKKNKCPKCPQKFIDYFSRRKHLVEIHGQEPILYKCNICDRGFNRKFSLSSHIKRCHLDQRDFKCEFCPYMCFTKAELREHMVKHDGSRPFVCNICKKSYGRNKALLIHMRTHNNDRRHVCMVCGRSFVQRGTLKAHMRTHKMDL